MKTTSVKFARKATRTMEFTEEEIIDAEVEIAEEEESEGEILNLNKDDLKVGTSFRNEEAALKSLEMWSYKALCAKTRYQKPNVDSGIKGKRSLRCPHGISRTSKSSASRPCQRVKYTNCPVVININEQNDGTWMVTTCVLTHNGHPVNEKKFQPSTNKKT